MSTAVDIQGGIAFVVTDLHGDWVAYSRYRDHFLHLYDLGQADILIFLGDVIHGYGSAAEDASVPIILDIMQLQTLIGPHRVVMVLGNHELPHIYGVPLAKGNLEFTSRFEHSLGDRRTEVIRFLKSLPFWVRTPGGVMLTHAGPTASIASQDIAAYFSTFSHDTLLGATDQLLDREDVTELIGEYFHMLPAEYDEAAQYYLGVNGPEDARYLDLLRGFLTSNLQEWSLINDFFFNQCEAGISASFYRQILRRFLESYSLEGCPQRVLVTGHMAVRGGFTVIADHQLRFASWTHAIPKDKSCFLLFDTARPVKMAEELVPLLHPLP